MGAEKEEIVESQAPLEAPAEPSEENVTPESSQPSSVNKNEDSPPGASQENTPQQSPAESAADASELVAAVEGLKVS